MTDNDKIEKCDFCSGRHEFTAGVLGDSGEVLCAHCLKPVARAALQRFYNRFYNRQCSDQVDAIFEHMNSENVRHRYKKTLQETADEIAANRPLSVSIIHDIWDIPIKTERSLWERFVLYWQTRRPNIG